MAALTSGLRQLGLSQWNIRELLAVEAELTAWHSAAPLVGVWGGARVTLHVQPASAHLRRTSRNFNGIP